MSANSASDYRNIWHPFTQMSKAGEPIEIISGEGACFYDVNNNKYIDGISSWWVNTHGHGNKFIAQRVSEQIKKLEHVIFDGFTHEPAVKTAELLLEALPGNQTKIFYSDNGSTAVEVALKMCLQYWYNKDEERTGIIAFNNSYHGDTFGSMSVSARNIFTQPFKKLLFDVLFIDAPADENASETILKLVQLITENKNKIAAFIFEPLIQGAAGMQMYNAEGLDKIISICKQHNIPCIADEVMTGFGRTGKYFAADYLENKPDIFCLSKGLTGGTMALGVTSCTQEIFDAFLNQKTTDIKTFFHGHSYTANPVACSAAWASLELMKEKNTWQNIERITALHIDFINRLTEHKAKVIPRSKGTILAIELITEELTGYLNPLREEIYPFFLERGIILRPIGNTIYVLPPYCITNEELNFIYQAIEEFIKTRMF